MMTLQDKQNSQAEVREQLLEFWESNFEPSWKVLAKEMDLTYSYLIEFKNGTRLMGQGALEKVIQFLDEHAEQ